MPSPPSSPIQIDAPSPPLSPMQIDTPPSESLPVPIPSDSPSTSGSRCHPSEHKFRTDLEDLAHKDSIPPPKHGQPGHEQWCYSGTQYASFSETGLSPVQSPTPSQSPPPAHTWYPTASMYHLVKDCSYERQYCYVSSFDPGTKDAVRTSVVKIETPPDAGKSVYDDEEKRFVETQVEGMIRMEPGVPYAVDIGPEARRLTLACVHTPSSIRQLPDGQEVISLAKTLFKEVWGDEESKPLFQEPLLTNERSGPPKPGVADGSYNLANNLNEGQGQGTAKPAVQTEDPFIKERIARVLVILSKLYAILMKASVSHTEWVAAQFMLKYLNTIMAGTHPGPTSVQMNVASTFNVQGLDEALKTLEEAIGELAGTMHPDQHDDIVLLSLVLLLLKLPPGASSDLSFSWHNCVAGSDPGKFFLGRPGLFVHSVEEIEKGSGLYFFAISFKGTDPHMGNPPTVIRQAMEDFQTDLRTRLVKEVRVVFVMYPGSGPSQRKVDQSFAPALGFGPQPVLVAPKSYMPNFVQHGYPSFGTKANQAQWIFRELLSMCQNVCASSKLLTMDLEKFREAFAIREEVNPENESLHYPVHPVDDAEQIEEMRLRYKWLSETAQLYHIFFRKRDLQIAKEQRTRPPPVTQAELIDTEEGTILDFDLVCYYPTLTLTFTTIQQVTLTYSVHQKGKAISKSQEELM
jgi:hypothetical protein